MEKNTSGIYFITNTANNKYYVGSSVCIRTRWNSHKLHLRKGIHDNKYLQKAWNKYGEKVFDFTVVEESTREKLLDLEQTYLDSIENWDFCYNICKSVFRPSERESYYINCHIDKRNDKWRLRLKFKGITARVGSFCTKEEALKEKENLISKFSTFSEGDSYKYLSEIKEKNKNIQTNKGIKLLDDGRWQVRIYLNKNTICCGTYSTREEALAIQLEAEKVYKFGEGSIKELETLIRNKKLNARDNSGKGVYDIGNGKFRARIVVNKKHYNSPTFFSRADALAWRLDMENKLSIKWKIN
jgi:group I intron endonuclease